MDTATVAMCPWPRSASSAHEVSSPATEIVQSQLASTSNESVVANDGARIACVFSATRCIGSAIVVLASPGREQQREEAAAAWKSYSRVCFS